MKATGIIRSVDNLGRIVIPKETRKKLGLQEGAPVEIFVRGDEVVITKYTPVCLFCGSKNEVVELMDKKVCCECVEKIKNLV